MKPALKDMIDRMVADSIRRILPSVMNEVLLATIARSGVLEEATSRAPKRRQPKSKPTSAPVKAKALTRQASKRQARRLSSPDSLRELLDESAGSEFYGNGGDEPDFQQSFDVGVETVAAPARSISSLPPHLQSLAEGISGGVDPNEMWQPGEHDSGVPVAGNGPSLDMAVTELGLDFSKMKSVIGKTSPKPVQSQTSQDRLAHAQFEANRIQRERLRLNGGKPIE